MRGENISEVKIGIRRDSVFESDQKSILLDDKC